MDLPHVLHNNLSNILHDLSGMGIGNDRYEIDNDLLSNNEYLKLNELKMNEKHYLIILRLSLKTIILFSLV